MYLVLYWSDDEHPGKWMLSAMFDTLDQAELHSFHHIHDVVYKKIVKVVAENV